MSNWYQVEYILYGELMKTTLIADSIEMVKQRLGYVKIIKWRII